LKDLKAACNGNIYTPVFTVALFTIGKTWAQPRYPSRDEWTKKMCCIYTMEYYSTTKNKIR
jgi:hypothetical protein